jgi:ABC-2 type transport system ATP-binding protein
MSQTKSKKEKSMAEMAIEINNLTKKYGDLVAVNNLSLKIRRGEVFGLLGPNGAGKTTTINMLNGLLKPTEGEIFVNGYNIKKDLKKIKNLIGVCPQHEAVYKFLTGRENIELFGILYDLKKQEIKERTDFLLKSINFVEESKRKAKTYSGGMLRILNMLMALIGNPEIIFLDEPTVGMDPRARRNVWKFISSLRENNKTVILTTHYIEEAEALSDTIAIIDYGELIALGPPKILLERYNAKNLEEIFLEITGRRILEGI